MGKLRGGDRQTHIDIRGVGGRPPLTIHCVPYDDNERLKGYTWMCGHTQCRCVTIANILCHGMTFTILIFRSNSCGRTLITAERILLMASFMAERSVLTSCGTSPSSLFPLKNDKNEEVSCLRGHSWELSTPRWKRTMLLQVELSRVFHWGAHKSRTRR